MKLFSNFQNGAKLASEKIFLKSQISFRDFVHIKFLKNCTNSVNLKKEKSSFNFFQKPQISFFQSFKLIFYILK